MKWTVALARFLEELTELVKDLREALAEQSPRVRERKAGGKS